MEEGRGRRSEEEEGGREEQGRSSKGQEEGGREEGGRGKRKGETSKVLREMVSERSWNDVSVVACVR